MRALFAMEEPTRTIGRLLFLAGTVLVCGAYASARAPAIESSTWLNTAGGQAPTLVGRPVLVEFWTFG
jgi:hypothetical protein